MNFIDLIVVVVVAVFVILFWQRGFFATIKSTISFLVGIILATISLDFVLSLLAKFGWEENVFTPLVAFPFLVVIFWGIFLTIFVAVPIQWRGILSSIFSIPISAIYALAVCAVVILVLPQLISLEAIDAVDASLFSKSLKKIPLYANYDEKFLSAIDEKLAKSIIVPQQENETIMLNIAGSTGIIAKRYAAEVLELTNRARQNAGLLPLQEDKLLDAFALSYADQIWHTDRFSHIDADGKTPYERANELGLKYNYIGENLALAQTVESAQNGLMASKSHRDNIESPVFRKIGIAVFDLGGSVLIVEEFAN